ncbi:MAG: hypothetical protein IT307_18640 [Chloroflexi bacterium]|nr:hypothetical protein [Chloroflexota bacterium]
MAVQERATVQWASPEQGRALFDAQARKLMDISGDEFLRRWDAGVFADQIDDPDHPEIMWLAMLIPFGR